MTDVVKESVTTRGKGDSQDRKADRTLQMADAMVVLHLCIMFRLGVEAESAVENFDLLFV